MEDNQGKLTTAKKKQALHSEHNNVGTSKVGLERFLEEAKSNYTEGNTNFTPDSLAADINYGRNFENYARNFENYARNFENYARNFENGGLITREQSTNSNSGITPHLPDGNTIPLNIEELLKKSALRKPR